MRRRTIEDKEKILSDHEIFKNKLKFRKEEMKRHERLLEEREADYDQKLVKLRRQRKLVWFTCYLFWELKAGYNNFLYQFWHPIAISFSCLFSWLIS